MGRPRKLTAEQQQAAAQGYRRSIRAPVGATVAILREVAAQLGVHVTTLYREWRRTLRPAAANVCSGHRPDQ